MKNNMIKTIILLQSICLYAMDDIEIEIEILPQPYVKASASIASLLNDKNFNVINHTVPEYGAAIEQSQENSLKKQSTLTHEGRYALRSVPVSAIKKQNPNINISFNHPIKVVTTNQITYQPMLYGRLLTSTSGYEPHQPINYKQVFKAYKNKLIQERYVIKNMTETNLKYFITKKCPAQERRSFKALFRASCRYKKLCQINEFLKILANDDEYLLSYAQIELNLQEALLNCSVHLDTKRKVLESYRDIFNQNKKEMPHGLAVLEIFEYNPDLWFEYKRLFVTIKK
jgi:hypothetical protein